MDPAILIFENPQAAAEACGDRTLALLDQARRDRGTATLAVSGGTTPRLMFQSMAKRGFDWKHVELFQVDERCVPADDAQSNFRMIRESLLLPAGIPEMQFHRVPTELPPVDAARAYTEEIQRILNLRPGELPVFDIIQRGMGPDAHTASLFPGEPLLDDRTGIAAAVWVEKFQQHRVTLLRGVLEQARYTLCLATGSEKANALHAVVRGPFDPAHLPSQIASHDMAWYLDEAAAALIRFGA